MKRANRCARTDGSTEPNYRKASLGKTSIHDQRERERGYNGLFITLDPKKF